MRVFKDKLEREWSVQLGLATCRHISQQTDGRVDFVEQARTGTGQDVFRALAEDLELLGQVAWLLCESQAMTRGVSELDFADAFDMDVLEQFQTALILAAIDFFPSRSRPVLQRALEIADRVGRAETAQTTQRAMQVMDSPEFEAAIRQAMTRGAAGKESGSGLA